MTMSSDDAALPGGIEVDLTPGLELDAPVADELIMRSLSPEDQLEVGEFAERLKRRAGDRALVVELEREGFEGLAYDRFAEELARYGLSVMRCWLRSGYIFILTTSRGCKVSPSDEDRHALSREPDLRMELANMTVAKALRKFRTQALIGGRWDPARGASLSTYFMGSCVYAFAGEWRRRRVTEGRWARQEAAVRYDLEQEPATDPADVAVGYLTVTEFLKSLPPREGRIAAAVFDGFSQAEIKEMFSETSVRAVEGVLYRLRNGNNQLRRGTDD